MRTFNPDFSPASGCSSRYGLASFRQLADFISPQILRCRSAQAPRRGHASGLLSALFELRRDKSPRRLVTALSYIAGSQATL